MCQTDVETADTVTAGLDGGRAGDRVGTRRQHVVGVAAVADARVVSINIGALRQVVVHAQTNLARITPSRARNSRGSLGSFSIVAPVADAAVGGLEIKLTVRNLGRNEPVL